LPDSRSLDRNLEEAVTLTGAKVARDATHVELLDIGIRKQRILSLGARTGGDVEIDLSGYLILPGLINAHDHLEFNLFPRLGHGPYTNAAAWAADIYRPGGSLVSDHLSVPKATRLFWGGLKNLLSGVTTVAHHNPYQPEVFTSAFPLRVVKRFGWAHSLDFNDDVPARFRSTPRRWPFVIHAGEGTDRRSREELSRLDQLRILRARSVLVHAVAADADALSTIARTQTSLIWCPSSNLFMLGRTVDPAVLDSGTRIALGSDSALTAEGDLLDELRVARHISSLDSERLYRMVTTDAARILRLTAGEGTIEKGTVADLLVLRGRNRTPGESLFCALPELVIVGGNIRLVSESLAGRIAPHLRHPLQRIQLEGRGAWFTDLDLRSAFAAAAPALRNDIRLAGRRVSL
jgi:cytosine/adenosine deaminase-related metal-dependent hydrolase